ncbi:MAG: hypothetical protein M5U34_41860 [Chloroflexi bacterium]|nr:hypothetical protein [Chloroflexota bacterium]
MTGCVKVVGMDGNLGEETAVFHQLCLGLANGVWLGLETHHSSHGQIALGQREYARAWRSVYHSPANCRT